MLPYNELEDDLHTMLGKLRKTITNMGHISKILFPTQYGAVRMTNISANVFTHQTTITYQLGDKDYDLVLEDYEHMDPSYIVDKTKEFFDAMLAGKPVGNGVYR